MFILPPLVAEWSDLVVETGVLIKVILWISLSCSNGNPAKHSFAMSSTCLLGLFGLDDAIQSSGQLLICHGERLLCWNRDSPNVWWGSVSFPCSFQEIRIADTWAKQCTFTRFYKVTNMLLGGFVWWSSPNTNPVSPKERVGSSWRKNELTFHRVESAEQSFLKGQNSTYSTIQTRQRC